MSGDTLPAVQRSPNVLVIVLAGGEGRRLAPLTNDRAKPAVPFGGSYRIIDFVLSNFANTGYLKIVVLTQYKSHSLDRHISPDMAVLDAARQLRHTGARADAQGPALVLRVGRRHLSESEPDLRRGSRRRVRFGADHIYRMDPRQMVEHHIESGAGVTVAAIPVPREQGPAFGVIESTASGQILAVPREGPRATLDAR